jgi:hypothetical protein
MVLNADTLKTDEQTFILSAEHRNRQFNIRVVEIFDDRNDTELLATATDRYADSAIRSAVDQAKGFGLPSDSATEMFTHLVDSLFI